jgi:heme exporter protein D
MQLHTPFDKGGYRGFVWLVTVSLLSLRAHSVCAAIRRSRREGAARGDLKQALSFLRNGQSVTEQELFTIRWKIV